MRPLLVGIGGGTASGKSTVAAALAERLGDQCAHLLHDRYYITLPAGQSAAEWNFDHPDALETSRFVRDLDALRTGVATRVPRYEYARHSRADEEDLIEPRPIVIVEGILVLADAALRARFDHAAFVYTPDDIRLIRRIRRDSAERGRTVSEILDQWEKTVRPMHEAFVAPSMSHVGQVLDGTAPIASLVDAILAVPVVRAAIA